MNWGFALGNCVPNTAAKRRNETSETKYKFVLVDIGVKRHYIGILQRRRVVDWPVHQYACRRIVFRTTITSVAIVRHVVLLVRHSTGAVCEPDRASHIVYAANPVKRNLVTLLGSRSPLATQMLSYGIRPASAQGHPSSSTARQTSCVRVAGVNAATRRKERRSVVWAVHTQAGNDTICGECSSRTPAML